MRSKETKIIETPFLPGFGEQTLAEQEAGVLRKKKENIPLNKQEQEIFDRIRDREIEEDIEARGREHGPA